MARYHLSNMRVLFNPKTYCDLHLAFQRFLNIEADPTITDIDNMCFYRGIPLLRINYKSGSYNRNTFLFPIFTLLHVRFPSYGLSVDDVLLKVKMGYYAFSNQRDPEKKVKSLVGPFLSGQSIDKDPGAARVPNEINSYIDFILKVTDKAL